MLKIENNNKINNPWTDDNGIDLLNNLWTDDNGIDLLWITNM